jgi:hypothetical protein
MYQFKNDIFPVNNLIEKHQIAFICKSNILTNVYLLLGIIIFE